ncbi:TPA: hypothetical protein ACKQCJ_002597 [Stenotrophomonas maltophilia]
MGKYVVTDLTRFKEGNDDVCTALIDIESGQCVRPTPYLKKEFVKGLGMLPGSIVEGEISPVRGASRPHREDCTYGDLKMIGAVTASEFKNILESSLSENVASGFGPDFDGMKFLPVDTKSDRSIITVKIKPDSFRVEKDNFGKYKVHFDDLSGKSYRYISITDLGFHEYIKSIGVGGADPAEEVNSHFKGAVDVYLRLGVSRVHEVAGKNGYWMQVNGIYSFPSKLQKIRGYAA